MDFKSLKRDPEEIRKNLILTKEGSYITKKPLTIYIPKRYEEKGMIVISKEVLIVGCFAMVIDNVYSVSSITSMVPIGPSLIGEVKIGEDDYYTFTFREMDVVVSYNRLVLNNQLPYLILDEIVNRGNVPPYYSYRDIGTILDSGKMYSGVDYSERQDVIQMFIALLARDSANPEQYYRHTIKDYKYMDEHNPEYVSLYSVSFAASSTFSKLLGAYFSEGVNSSLITDNTEVDRIEALIRA